MMNELVMDANALGTLLDALAESLRSPRGGPSSPAQLAADLGKMAETARTWARQNQIPISCIPREPGPDATNERGAEFLSALAEAVRYLAPRLENMRDVVELLKARQALALIELSEFDFALKELFPNFMACEETLGVVCAEITSTNILDSERELRDGLDHAHDRLRHLVVAFSEICKGVRGWGLLSIHSEPPPESSARPS